MKKYLMTLIMVVSLIVSGFSLVAPAQPVAAEHGPFPDVIETLLPGESVNVLKEVLTHPIPAKLDIFLLEDETGSFANDIANLKVLAPQIWDAIADFGADFTMGVGGFRDFARDNWGGSNDWVFRRQQDLTTDKAQFVAGVNQLTASGGLDEPEAYLEALYYIANPAHPGIDSNGDGDLLDLNDTPAGRQPTWREGARRIVLLTTDASCHIQGDYGGWPGSDMTASPELTANYLDAAGITVIGLTPTGSGLLTCVATLASITGGSLQATTTSGILIKDAIIAGIGELASDVWWVITMPNPNLIIELVPTVHENVVGGTTVYFEETITVAPDASPGVHIAEVSFYENSYPIPGSLIGTQHIEITVPVSCEAFATDFSICAGTPINQQLFLDNGAYCDGGCTMVIEQSINNMVPGSYPYTILCYEGDIVRDSADGTVTVVAACMANAPDFSICVGATVNDALFAGKGAGCSGGCTPVFSYSVNSAVPGEYSYTVTCDNGVCPPSVDTGSVTVVAPCIVEAADFSICEGTLVNDQLFLDNGASCSDGCTVFISHDVNSAVPGVYSYTITCDNGVCVAVMDSGSVTVVAACAASAPDFSICVGTPVDNQLFLDNGASCTDGCSIDIVHNINCAIPGEYSYTVTCDNGVCEPTIATGSVTVVPVCALVTPDFNLCTGTIIDNQLFIDHGLICGDGCTLSIVHTIDTNTPGTYLYTATCDNGICPPAIDIGFVTVYEPCNVVAPDFSICTGTIVNQALFLSNGVTYSDGCSLDIDHQVNPDVPGVYPYTATATNGVCVPVVDSGVVTVVGQCTVMAPDFSLCLGTTVTEQVFVDNGVICGDGCTMEITHDINPDMVGEYSYTITCDNGVCPPVVDSGTVTVVSACTVVAPDFHICQYTPVTYKLFTDNGVFCSEGCCMDIDRSLVDSTVPGCYEYTVTCFECPDGACPPVSATGLVCVDVLAQAFAPDFAVCRNTQLSDQLFIDNGVHCSLDCTLDIDYSGVNPVVPGDYTYTVTCTNACGPAVVEGTITICTDITSVAPTVIVCEGYTNDDLYNAVLVAGGGCDDGGCDLEVDSVIDNGNGTYTLVCQNACGCAVETGNIVVCPEPTSFAPAVELCLGYSQGDLESAVEAAGGQCECGNCGCTFRIIVDNGNYSYTMLCYNQCGCSVAIGTITLIECEPPETMVLNLTSGWNLVSMPCYVPPDERAPEVQLADIMGDLNTAYAYLPDFPGGIWKTYSPPGIGSLDEIGDGWGYWLLMDAPGTLTFDYDQMPEPPGPPPCYHLSQGWNLIGVRSAVPVIANDYLASIAGKWAIIYGYSDGAYFMVNGNQALMPGCGYWIAMIEEGDICY